MKNICIEMKIVVVRGLISSVFGGIIYDCELLFVILGIEYPL